MPIHSEGGVAAPAECVYELDLGLRLVAVDAAWSAFAVANGAPQLVPPRIIGAPVLAAIADHTTAAVYRQVFDRVQVCREPVAFPIRCDSPGLRRYLDIEIALRAGGFLVRSAVVRTEPRPVQDLLVAERPGDGTYLHQCSWCKKIDANGAWVEVEDAIKALNLFARPVLPKISHTMCESCHADMMKLID